ncbi:hypothetical protein [Streptomyces ardesiacus]|uniref:N-acetyltransferase domain-containing protein n=1 Tax=Streptomyces ardesiacus TaxID=285564 RepID=A0ABW8HKT4_9ACTN
MGLAEYEEGDERGSADLAVAAAEGLHRRGVCTLLVEHLASAARADGMTPFRVDALSENREAMRLLRSGEASHPSSRRTRDASPSHGDRPVLVGAVTGRGLRPHRTRASPVANS